MVPQKSSEFRMCRAGQWRGGCERRGVLGQNVALLHERIDRTFSSIGVLLRALVALFERWSRISVGLAFLLCGGEGDVRAGEAAQFALRESLGARIPAREGGYRHGDLGDFDGSDWIASCVQWR